MTEKNIRDPISFELKKIEKRSKQIHAAMVGVVPSAGLISQWLLSKR